MGDKATDKHIWKDPTDEYLKKLEEKRILSKEFTGKIVIFANQGGSGELEITKKLK